MKLLLTILFAITTWAGCRADTLDSLETALRDDPQIQEKIYIHTDNNCYFLGDTLWYKAYVLRSDNLVPTNMSRLLYVELLTPEGMVVERQHIIVSGSGDTCGQFVLTDSLYSGFYELRAYTRWQLNFNVTHKEHSFIDSRQFYNNQMANDFFRMFEGLYSRVFPVYSKPKTEGDWNEKYMFHRSKQNILKERSFLTCQFFPEGGSLVKGIKNRVAFELTDNNGQAMDIKGTLPNGQTIRPKHMGRGVFEITPTSSNTKVTFECDGKTYSFHLPKAEERGVVINYDHKTRNITLNAQGIKPAALSVSCRGSLVTFKRIADDAGTISLAGESIPTGINEIIVYDEQAQPLATRLFFVNNHDIGAPLTKQMNLAADNTEVKDNFTVSPFAKVRLNVSAENAQGERPRVVSVAVRDARTDENGYDNGNIMTDMLLSGDLKGFVAYPSYYFEFDDEEHSRNLDLLMMVQGWRKYKRVEQLRYQPETSLTYEGRVLQVPSNADMIELEDLNNVAQNADLHGLPLEANKINFNRADNLTELGEELASSEDPNDWSTETEPEPEITYSELDYYTSKKMKKPVYVEAELAVGKQVAGAVTETDSTGHFIINLPPFYDKAALMVKAYNKKDSLEKCMTSSKGDKNRNNERAYPDYYVKRDMFFPVFSQPYSWYQVNSPEVYFVDEDDDELIPENSKLAGNHTLQTVVVKAKRRGKRSIDWSQPAYVRDAYELFNDATDYGLTCGVVNFKELPTKISTLLYANMGRLRMYNVRAMINNTTFFRNYTPDANEFDVMTTPAALFRSLQLKRIKNIRAYTDYEIRTDSGAVANTNAANVTLVFEPVPDDGTRYTFRDRHYIIDGVTYAEEFYNRSYSGLEPKDNKDYRRTLYWNPNAKLDENGTFTDSFFNNSKESRLRISAAGISRDGGLFY